MIISREELGDELRRMRRLGHGSGELRVVTAGSRSDVEIDIGLVNEALEEVLDCFGPFGIMTGACGLSDGAPALKLAGSRESHGKVHRLWTADWRSMRGYDRAVSMWADRHLGGYFSEAADWDSLGYRAGPARNARMMYIFEPHLVLAFPGGRGTSSCVSAAREHHVEMIFEVE